MKSLYHFASACLLAVTVAASSTWAESPEAEPYFGGEPLSQLLKSIEEGDDDERIFALSKLVYCGPEARAAIPVLLKASRQKPKLWSALCFVCLGRIGAPAVPKLKEMLRDDNPGVYFGAALAFSQMRGADARAALPELQAALNKGRGEIYIAEALAKIGPAAKESVPKLRKLLKTKDAEDRAKVANALWRIDAGTREEMRAVLVQLLDDENEVVRRAAIDSLVDLAEEDRSLLPLLHKRVEDKSRNARVLLIAGLIHFMDDRNTARLIEQALRDKDVDVRWWAALGLLRAGVKSEAALEIMKGENENHLPEFLAGEAQDRALPLLEEMLRSKSAEKRMAALKAARSLGWHAQDLAPTLSKMLPSPPWAERAALLKALSSIGPGAHSAVPALVNMIRRGDEPFTAALTLCEIGPPAVPSLLECLKDRDRDVRFAGVMALKWMGRPAGPKTVAPLEALLADDVDDEFFRHTALAHNLVGGDSARILPTLLKNLEAQKPSRRALAANLIGFVGAHKGVPALRKRLGDRSGQVRAAAAEALGSLGDKESTAVLGKMLVDHDPEVREAAERAILKIHPEDGAARVANLREKFRRRPK